MAYYGTLEVVDRTGWTKTYPLEKALLMIGSADFNDIVLPEERGLGVFPAHLQLMRPAVELGSIRLVNLSAAPVTLIRDGHTGETLPGGGTAELEDGDGLRLGGFGLAFSIQSLGGVSRSARSEHLGLKLELPGGALRPLKQLAGRLTVTNYGSQPRCQFELEIEGLPAGCCRIDPAPLLFPHGEGQMQIRFYHRGAQPAGGPQPVLLRATAPGAYPTEEVTLEWNLDVAPLETVELVVDEDPLAPWERESKGSVAAMPQAPIPPAPVFFTGEAAGIALAGSSGAGEDFSHGNGKSVQHHEAGETLFDAPPPLSPMPHQAVPPAAAPPAVAVPPAAAPNHPADADWWEDGSGSQQEATGARLGAKPAAASRRLHPQLNAQKITVLRNTPDPENGTGAVPGPSPEAFEEVL